MNFVFLCAIVAVGHGAAAHGCHRLAAMWLGSRHYQLHRRVSAAGTLERGCAGFQ